MYLNQYLIDIASFKQDVNTHCRRFNFISVVVFITDNFCTYFYLNAHLLVPPLAFCLVGDLLTRIRTAKC